MKTTWRELLSTKLRENNESGKDIVSNTMSDADMDKVFYSGYGGSEGCAFTVWTTDFVYFPVVYDGCEWVGFTQRNPNGIATEHQGGE